ncbi:SusC/RagA family TonB-linked outer membrane protein [Mucilaginibacter terrae]|uniref:TonB-linked SusC/RagA family outer membrane protein n=1 Tax=Mucilaginibacter terrae TaxID=1955052 RepID=A0ABU3H020_9SPHI|nr:SusC/RagA family TonB-linked outer membrane protein [Mucilaginibacter terrae]MDT3405364.1 TonB-linked SusC/RagA family outer membrane protein [Mucilaginibacter terrae]
MKTYIKAQRGNGRSDRYSCPAKMFYLTVLLLITFVGVSVAQGQRSVKGQVFDTQKNTIVGAVVRVKGTNTVTQTNSKGEFAVTVRGSAPVLVISYVGMTTQEIDVKDKDFVNVNLKDNVSQLGEVVVTVAYGQQKKQSVVGAIVQTDSKTLERTGGVSSLGAALTGNLPGVVTTASTGIPGGEDPQILIRARSTWNNASPLVLVDGVERSINNIDIASVATVSVLKDASATAVFGVRGANGVILITTKRGREGKAEIRASVNTVVKSPSKLPGRLDSYDMFQLRNRAIENELALRPTAWNDIMPQDIINKYRFPANETERERYPNVDWVETLFKNDALSYNANMNITGGTKSVKYFTSADYLKEGDLFKTFDNNRGYTAGYAFNRLNIRSNLDFQITPSTTFRTNIYGSRGVRKRPWININEYNTWGAAYYTAPNLFLPKYSDGSWGYYAPNTGQGTNSAMLLATSGSETITTSRITTDFTIEQSLNMFVKGLSIRGNVSVDNTFIENGRGINDVNNPTQQKYIDPQTGNVSYSADKDPSTQFSFKESDRWAAAGGAVDNGATLRRLFSQVQLNYNTTIAKDHAVTATGLWNRDQIATGSVIPSYREEWVFRTTYGYRGKYNFEYNGAYNGSEKFAPDYRFAFFSSAGANWMISEEKFMKPLKFVNLLKLRGSYGDIGDDSGSPRFAYLSEWSFGGRTRLGTSGIPAEQSVYQWYRQTSVGNPNVRWEKVKKANIGIDFGLFNGVLTGSVDVFRDRRTDILSSGGNRAIPSYYGANAPTANKGRVDASGYEFDIRFSKSLTQNIRLWSNINFTHAQNKVIVADIPQLLPDYQKTEGKQIFQNYSYVSSGYYNNWDEVYASTAHAENDNQKIPGNFYILDYNADGVINASDNIPYGHTGNPENTYNATLGLDYKNFSAFVQFYGVNNVTRQVVLNSFGGQNTLAFDQGSYWSKDNNNPDVPLPRWASTPSGYQDGNRYFYDASYIRLKNAEIAYTFNQPWVKKIGISTLRVFVNGNNLAVWSKMPDDREANYQSSGGQGWASQGAYPTVKRYNFGANITF